MIGEQASTRSELGVPELGEQLVVGRRAGGSGAFRAGDRLSWVRSDLAAGAGAALLALTIASWALRLWRADLSIPMRYSSQDDALFYVALIKGMIHHGWVFTNHGLGAPFGQQLFDFPQSADSLNLLLIKGLTLLSGNAAVVINVFYLMTYPLDALAAFWVLRRLGVSRGGSLACATLFALLPYHFWRGDSHLFLSAYYSLPLTAYLFVSILGGRPLFARRAPPARGPRAWLTRRSAETVVICVVIASGGLYYAVFGLTLLAAGVLLGVVARRGPRVLLTGTAAFALVSAMLAANLAPTVVYQLEHGSNHRVSRSAAAGDTLGLSPAYLVLPNIDDRIKPLRNVTHRYDSGTRTQPYCEQCHEALGVAGDVGLAWLGLLGAGALLGVPLLARRRSLYRHAAVGVAVCLAVGVTGGISSLIAVFVTADIRAWNRLSVLIAFFALMATGLLLDALRQRLRFRRAGLAFAGLLAGVVAFGAVDQSNPSALVPYAQDAVVYNSDQAFFAGVRSALPGGSTVFQLPYVPFPEGYQPDQRPDQTVPYARNLGLEYDQARGFINADGLRWSFGAVKGRLTDWEAQLAAKPVRLAVIGAAAAGFSGMVVNLSGYPNADALEHALRGILGMSPSVSAWGDFAFYDLRPFARRLRATQPAARLAALKRAVLTPLALSCTPRALMIYNPGPTSRRATLVTSARGSVTVAGVAVGPQEGAVRLPITIAPGTTTLALGGSEGSRLIGSTLIDQAFAPFAHGAGSTILSGIVGPPCLDVPAQASS